MTPRINASDHQPADSGVESATPVKVLSEAARRALAEAEDRRRSAAAVSGADERGGPAGPEPTRFGDWERKGLAIDF